MKLVEFFRQFEGSLSKREVGRLLSILVDVHRLSVFAVDLTQFACWHIV